MTIYVTHGNFLEADAEALVNTVNCVGVMGKGIALQSKKAFPDNYDAYARACRRGEVEPGRVLVFETKQMFGPRYIINVPTKRHWKDRSRYEDIAAGLNSLVDEIRSRRIKSVAVPPLGCGLGGLDWTMVRPMIEEAFSQLPELEVHLYEPADAPDAREMPVRTKRPRMTVARALLIKLIEQYNREAYRLTLLEIQKLAYFLQKSGQNLRLSYVKLTYGPYAHNLNKVLEVLEGHFITGYGDSQKPDVEIELLPDAIREADVLLAHHPDEERRLQRVSSLVEGFETPYGLELLASVHWGAEHEDSVFDDDTAIEQVERWNERKRRLFKHRHMRAAWDRLAAHGWVPREKMPPYDEPDGGRSGK